MPNYCSNTLICTSGKNIGEVLKPYISTRDEDKDQPNDRSSSFLDFQKIHPMPENPVVENKDYEAMPDWYNWRVENWGTKWNSIENPTLDSCDDDHKLEDVDAYFFTTAWAPAIGVISKLSEITGESFALYYEEEGIGFFGKATCTPNLTEDQEFLYEEDATEIDPESDIYQYCGLECYFENLEDEEENE
jgi:hypothetical protein